jgi:hypothetical protein
MGRTPGHPWVGESVVMDLALPVDGSPFSDFGDAIRYRQRNGFDSSTLDAGESFLAGFYDSESLLSGDAVVASFVVVCSGTGTLRLSTGLDTDLDLVDPGLASTPLGTHTVSGDTVVVATLPSFDVDAYLATPGYTVAFVECLSGSVVIQQIKLRLWPPGGAVGGWADGAAFEATTIPNIASAAQVDGGIDTGTEVGGDAFSAWLIAAQLLVDLTAPGDARALDPATIPLSAIEASAQVFASVTEVEVDAEFHANAQGRLTGSIAQQADPVETAQDRALDTLPGTWGLDFMWPPDEVPGDYGVQLVGTPTTAWGESVLTTVVLTPMTDGTGGQPRVIVTPLDDEAFVDRSLVTLPLADGDPIPILGGTTNLDLPVSRTVLVSMSHPSLLTAPLYAGTAGAYALGVLGSEVSATLEDSIVTVPGFRYWAPTVVARRVLRQLHRDDGQGVTPPRAFGGASRIRTRRAYGYD